MSDKDYEGGIDKINRVRPFTNFSFNIIFLLLAIICVLPVLFIISISFSSETVIQEFGYALFPRVFSLKAYEFLWGNRTLIFRALGVSLFVTVVGMAIGVVLTTTMGYVLSRPQYKLKGLLTWLVFIPMVFNGGMVSTYYVNSNLLGIKNTVWALILPLCVSSFNVVISKTFFRSTVPDSLVESAKIDGASQLGIYARIVLPISMPVLATIALFLCFTYWNDWFQSMLYIDESSKYSLQALLTQIMYNAEYLARNAATMGISAAEISRNMPKEGARMAIAVIIVVPIACAYPFFQKYFITGLTVGAIKG